jgi:hypothetical protein
MRCLEHLQALGRTGVVAPAAMTATHAGARTPLIPPQDKSSEDLAGLRAAAERFVRALDDLDGDPFRASWAAEATVFFPFADAPDRVTGEHGPWKLAHMHASGATPP